ncbi:hypothetical protein NDR87_33405 [Nocardia sp. CDC159]|uniref:Uncharacterized protein n=1 Tax=Nocardia pulmonis TaxID=2951408 RepID=A0A9X2ECP0_9NOCA|nr:MULTISPECIES: hypothetical protein [Nocardia]MCM6778322.1 hypothetical protein [Nocardia pulmonis]MCM6791282.1 hypothetical protein [Nocardia sp. CDC159]
MPGETENPAVQRLSAALAEMVTGVTPYRLLGPTGIGAPTLLQPPPRAATPAAQPPPEPKRNTFGPSGIGTTSLSICRDFHRSRG